MERWGMHVHLVEGVRKRCREAKKKKKKKKKKKREEKECISFAI